MIRLVAFDLDGTVLDGGNHASEASFETIRELTRQGIGIASVSGRNVGKSLAPFAEASDLTDAFYVGSYNGAVALGPAIGGPRRLLMEGRLPAEAFREVVDYIGAQGFNFVYCRCEIGREGVREEYITDRETASIRGLSAQTGMAFVFDNNLIPRIEAGELGPSPKLLILPGRNHRDAALEELRRTFDGRLYLARTGEDRIEAMHPEVNKAVALNAIARACGVSLPETLAVGDGDNDLPMLQAAGTGVLLGNADEETRRSAVDAGIRMGAPFEDEGFSTAVREYALKGTRE